MNFVVILYYTIPTHCMSAPRPALHFSTASLQASFCLSTLTRDVYLFFSMTRRDTRERRPTTQHAGNAQIANKPSTRYTKMTFVLQNC